MGKKRKGESEQTERQVRQSQDRVVYASIPHLNLFILFYAKEFNVGGKGRRNMEMDAEAGDKTEVSGCREVERERRSDEEGKVTRREGKLGGRGRTNSF